MAAETLERRLEAVENEIAEIKRRLEGEKPRTGTAGWEKIVGTFADSEGFEEATRLGREWREAQNAGDNPATEGPH